MDPQQHEHSYLVGRTDDRAALEDALAPIEAELIEAFPAGDGEIVIVEAAEVLLDDIRPRLGPNVETTDSEDAAFELARAAKEGRPREA